MPQITPSMLTTTRTCRALAALFALVALPLAGASCASKGADPRAAGDTPADAADAAAPAGRADAGDPTPPADARWTILCTSIKGPGHIQRARAMKDELKKSSGMDDWYVLHKEDESLLFHGYYSTYDSGTRAGRRAQADREAIDTIRDQNGERPFRLAIFQPLDTPDPQAPPEWDLTRADGFWSLEIASYVGDPQLRKQYAVEAVRAAREQGIEAYYYHGEQSSSVCIGSWPREAVKEQATDAAQGVDPDAPIAILPAQMDLPEGPLYDKQGRRVQAFVPKFEVLDRHMLAVMDRFPYHAINGELPTLRVRDKQTGRMVDRPRDKSFVVQIPREADEAPSLLDGRAAGTPSQQELIIAPDPTAVTPDGAGRLRGFGE